MKQWSTRKPNKYWNPFENSAFEKNAQHIHTNIATFKSKPESNDMLHFSKIVKLEAKFDILKSLLTCEISTLANTLDSLSLVSHEILKTLEQHDVINNKLLLENFEFHRKEVLSKDKFIKYLLNRNTNYSSRCSYISEKSRKNTRENTKDKFSLTTTITTTTTTATTKIYKASVYNNTFYVNTAFAKINHSLSLKFLIESQTAKQQRM